MIYVALFIVGFWALAATLYLFDAKQEIERLNARHVWDQNQIKHLGKLADAMQERANASRHE